MRSAAASMIPLNNSASEGDNHHLQLVSLTASMRKARKRRAEMSPSLYEAAVAQSAEGWAEEQKVLSSRPTMTWRAVEKTKPYKASNMPPLLDQVTLSPPSQHTTHAPTGPNRPQHQNQPWILAAQTERLVEKPVFKILFLNLA